LGFLIYRTQGRGLVGGVSSIKVVGAVFRIKQRAFGRWRRVGLPAPDRFLGRRWQGSELILFLLLEPVHARENVGHIGVAEGD
jgi:hypothetical protein